MSGLLKPLRRGVWRYLGDRDILAAALVTLLAVIGTLGLLYVVHLMRTWRLARHAPAQAGHRGTLLVFGRRLVEGRPEADFIARLERARRDALDGRADRVLLLGGSADGGTSEAEAGQHWLRQGDWPSGVPLTLEQVSVDSLENLRHARELLRDDDGGPLPPVWLVTSRYHLARCMYLATRLGFDASPLAAEDRLRLSRRYVVRLAMEAGYIMWIDTGLRWAALTGNRRMVARVT
ncbi:YdcF family protein [Luteibacter aegosomatis]|uniref:YdcF family protein n=1 Tax=Luteibacter aegosomatis TaxID=2911537 RepID=UPI001FFB75CD|nr:YdcF family protein [Luteibacter aegosomatis]UPG86054.1 YdcF family protein [Luteibacter aegosomatis]